MQGLREITRVADGADAFPPVSWAYWAWDAFKGPHGDADKRWGVISRSYPMRISGQLLSMRGGGSKLNFELEFRTGTHMCNNTTYVPSSPGASDSLIYFAPGMSNTVVTVRPKDAVIQVPGGLRSGILYLCNKLKETRVVVTIEKKAKNFHVANAG